MNIRVIVGRSIKAVVGKRIWELFWKVFWKIRGRIIERAWEIIKREINFYRFRPTNVLLFLTYRCPSRCRVCEVWKWEQMGIAVKDKELDIEDWKHFVDMIADLKVSNVEIFGGEALLRRDIVPPLVKYIAGKGVEADVVTNGLTMDEELAHDLVEAGLNDIYFSVDGVGEVHDYVRRIKGNFAKLQEGIHYMLKARGERKKPGIICNCTISSLNVNDFEHVLPFAVEVGADSVHFEYVGEMKSENVNRSVIDGIIARPYFKADEGASYLLNSDQAILLKRKLASVKLLARQLRFRISTKNIDILTVSDLVNGRFPNKKCYITRYLISVDPYGNVMGCPFFNNYYIGNIQDESIKSIWKNQKHRKFVKLQKLGYFGICRNCIVGVQRNATFSESLQQWYMELTLTGKETSDQN
jgi:MoaA/NifB/PqqE/SkfB family radical SAM enzyme